MFDKNKDLSVNQWIFIFIVLAIPIFNLIALISWAIAGDKINNSLRNFSRAIFKLSFISIIIYLGIFIGLGNSFNISVNTTYTNFMEETYRGLNQKYHAEDKISFDNFTWREEIGVITVNGEVTNYDNKSHSFSVIISFYDENRQLLGTADGMISHINAGSTKTFEAMTTDKKVIKAKNYKVDISDMLY